MANKNAPLAKLEQVRKDFGKQNVLRGIDLELSAGSITGLVGPSGSGKTTIVNMIVGTHNATDGSITVLGEQPPFKTMRQRLGYMPQSEALYSDLTANENLRFFGALYGMSRHELNKEIPRVLELVHLADQGRKVVTDFSGGMKRRLSLAIALLHGPDLLVLDEPTVGLDPLHRVELWRTFRERADAGAALLVTTHVMDEAASCDRIVMIHDGLIIADGTDAELMAATKTDTLEDAFLAFEERSLRDELEGRENLPSETSATETSTKEGGNNA
ncbi:MAG: ABC transporter ATP-binding protein [Coriobacteriia bacterium]|nr:ABC transporter ATP-binding protein [Coriobacteriia bacterium]